MRKLVNKLIFVLHTEPWIVSPSSPQRLPGRQLLTSSIFTFPSCDMLCAEGLSLNSILFALLSSQFNAGMQRGTGSDRVLGHVNHVVVLISAYLQPGSALLSV